MKTDNIFDLLVIDNETFNTEEISMPEGVSAVNIKSLVFDRLSGKASSKRRKKPYIIMIAAAILAGTLFTTAAATGAFNNIFGNNVVMQSDSIPVTTVPFDVESDELNIVCNGLTGDEDNVFVAYTITKKDGSPFVNSADGLSVRNLGDDLTYQKIKISTSKDSKTYSVCRSGNITYTFTDERTVSAFAYIQQSNICKRKITLSEQEVFAYRFVREIYKPEESNGSFSDELIQKYTDEYKTQLKENEVIRFDPEHRAVCIFERYEIPLDYEASFIIDDLSERKPLISEPTAIVIDGQEYNITEITCGGCSISLSAELGSGHTFKPLLKDIAIELNNGTVLNAEPYSGGNPCNSSNGCSDTAVFSGKYILCERSNGFRFTPADPKDIRSITIGGQTIECGGE